MIKLATGTLFRDVSVEIPFWTVKGQESATITYTIPDNATPDLRNEAFARAVRKASKKLRKEQKLCSALST